MARRPTIADLLSRRDARPLPMLRVETLDEARAAARAGVAMLSVSPSMMLDPRFRDAAPDAFAIPGENFYEIGGPGDFLKWALPLYKAGADAVYCSGSLATVRLLAEHAIPVCGHVGLIPSKCTWTGGFKAVGKTLETAKLVWSQIRALEEAGAFAAEIEVVPHSVAALIAGQSADAYTTLRPNPGTYEFNPLGPRGVVIEKVAATSLLLGVEWVVARHRPDRLRKFAWLNYGLGGMFTGFAIYDARLKN